MRRVAALTALVIMVAGCGFTRVDAPITFSSDRRLEVTSPSPEDDVGLPVRVTWEVEDFELGGGNHFGVFVDRVPLGPKRSVRLRICTEGEKLPAQAGSFRKVCKDDRKEVFFTAEPFYEFDCFEPRFQAPKRSRNTHTVSIVLLDGDNRRVGHAIDSVRFEVDADDARRCRGL